MLFFSSRFALGRYFVQCQPIHATACGGFQPMSSSTVATAHTAVYHLCSDASGGFHRCYRPRTDTPNSTKPHLMVATTCHRRFVRNILSVLIMWVYSLLDSAGPPVYHLWIVLLVQAFAVASLRRSHWSVQSRVRYLWRRLYLTHLGRPTSSSGVRTTWRR